MKSSTNDTRDKPEWVTSGSCRALIVRCGQCFDRPGSKHDDASGTCPACFGSGWHVLVKKVGGLV